MKQTYIWALTFSIVLHLLLGLGLFLGNFSAKPLVTSVVKAPPIQAVVVDQNKVAQKVKKIKAQQAAAKAAEKKRLRQVEDRIAKAKRKRKKEEARIKDLERQRRAKEQEKKKADIAAKKSKAKAAAAEKSRQKKVAERKKAEQALAATKAKRLKAEKAAKLAAEKKATQQRKKAAEQRRKEQEARERAEQERLLAQQMEAEMATRQRARKQQMMSEISRYTALITQTIQRHFITDRSTMEGKSCKLTISLTASGFVTNVVIGKGERIVCQAAQKAIYKAGTLPVSKDPEVFKEMKQISVTVSPEF